MSTMAMASSSLNPNAPLFIPAAYRQVEDYSPEWWDLVKTTAWFRDHWFRQHQLHDAAHDHDAALAALPDDLDLDDVAALLPDDSVDLLLGTEDLFYAPDTHHHQAADAKPALLQVPGYDLDALRALSLGYGYSPRDVGATTPRPHQQQLQQHRHADKPAAHHVGVRGAARRAIHQPR